jgi:hypothetical protein
MVQAAPQLLQLPELHEEHPPPLGAALPPMSSENPELLPDLE